MFKLLVTLGTFLLVALAMFGLRQQRLEINAQCVRLYHDIDNRNDTLRSQRVEISRASSAKALAMGLKSAGMDTGDALTMRDGRTGRSRTTPRVAPGQVETDLIETLRGGNGTDAASGHSNPGRPRG